MSGELSQLGEVKNIERGILWTKTMHNLQYMNKESVSHEESVFTTCVTISFLTSWQYYTKAYRKYRGLTSHSLASPVKI